MKKIFKNPIFTFMLGAIIFGSIAGVVAYNYNAKDVSYTPSDSSWNVTNVDDAIKDMHSNINTTVASLNREKNELQNQLNSLETKTSSFNFVSGGTTKTFNLGFRPKYISCTGLIDNGKIYVDIIYNKDYNANKVVRMTSMYNNGNGGCHTTSDATPDVSRFFTINDNGFTWNIANHEVWNNSTIYCVASK